VGTADLLGLTNLVLQHRQRRLATQLSPAGTGSAGWQRQRQHRILEREISEEPGKTRASSLTAAPDKCKEDRIRNQDALCRLKEQPETPQDARSGTSHRQAGGNSLAGTGKGLESHREQS